MNWKYVLEYMDLKWKMILFQSHFNSGVCLIRILGKIETWPDPLGIQRLLELYQF